MSQAPSVHLSLRVHPTLKSRIEQAADSEGMGRAEYTRLLLLLGLELREQRLDGVREKMSNGGTAP